MFSYHLFRLCQQPTFPMRGRKRLEAAIRPISRSGFGAPHLNLSVEPRQILAIASDHLDHHTNYIDDWLEPLGREDRAVLTAAARAEEASTLPLTLGSRVSMGVVGEAGADVLAA
jgi:hypothetical protein